MNPSSTWQVFTITVTQLQGGGGAKTELSADLNLVDLAGSERAVSSGAQVCCCCATPGCCCDVIISSEGLLLCRAGHKVEGGRRD